MPEYHTIPVVYLVLLHAKRGEDGEVFLGLNNKFKMPRFGQPASVKEWS